MIAERALGTKRDQPGAVKRSGGFPEKAAAHIDQMFGSG
jgi:hypothetical protein